MNLLQGQATIETANLNFNGGTNVIYANSPVSISTFNINRGTVPIPSGVTLGLMVSVDGDAPTLVTSQALQDTLITYGTPITRPLTQTPAAWIYNNNYVFNSARFGGGGGGLVHDIIIWPTKIGSGGPTVITSDTVRLRALYIDAAAFRVTNQQVLGLSGTIDLDTYYSINAIAENVGLSANTRDLQFFIQLDDFSPRLLGTTSNSVAPGNQYGMVIPSFRIRNYYPTLPINSAFRAAPHLLKVYAQEKTKVNTVGIAEFMVDASNSFPVELLAFDGLVNENQIDLNWATLSERGNSHFLLQKMQQEQGTYETLGRIEGTGFADTLNAYSFVDAQPDAGVNTYRLVQVDMDGTAVVAGENLEIFYQLPTAQMELIQAFPNPFETHTTLHLQMPEAGKLRVEAFDIMGKRVHSNEQEVSAGVEQIQLDLSDQVAGTYLYRLSLNGQSLSGKIVKR
jgi:hypothetical protein